MRRVDKLWLGLAFALAINIVTNAWADSNNAVRFTGAQTPDDCVKISATNVLVDAGAPCGSGGGGSLSVTSTNANVDYYALLVTNTGGAVSAAFIDKVSPLVYHGSTGLWSALGLTTSTLTNNGTTTLTGSTALVGTTTLSSGALNVTTTVNAARAKLLNVASGTQCLHADASGNVTGTGSDCGGGGGAAFTPVLLPLSMTTSDIAGNVFPYTYLGATTTTASAVGSPSWGVAASLPADTLLRYRFVMPPTLPATGTLNLCSICQANATTGNVKYTITDAAIATNNTGSPGGTPTNSETQTSITWSAVDNYVTTCTPLTATPATNGMIAGAITFNTASWTLAQILSCNWVMRWQ